MRLVMKETDSLSPTCSDGLLALALGLARCMPSLAVY